MKTKFLTFVLLCFGLTLTVAQAQSADEKILELINTGNHFELLKQYKQNKGKITEPIIGAIAELKLDVSINDREMQNDVGHGRLGVDFIKLFDKVTMNFGRGMHIELEK